jgi:type II secretory pathway predicted ATPase ExeA
MFPNFKRDVEKVIASNVIARAWLHEHGYKPSDIWTELGKRLRNHRPEGAGARIAAGRAFKAVVLDNPAIGKLTQEVEMLTAKARKQFRIFQTPFGDNIDPTKDVFLSEDHRYIYMAMKEAAEHSGMIAVIGEVGSGKTVMRLLFAEEIGQNENMRIIFPRIVDKTRITAGSICDAIIMDLAGRDAKIKQKLEQKSRQVEDLIVSRAKSGIRMVMLIEEAQDLAACPRVLKLFKRFHEIEANGKKVLGIILVGQPELGELLNEGDHYDMREVIRRMQVAEIQGLNGSIKEYLNHRFKRVNLDLTACITDGAIDALGKRLTAKEGGHEVSVAYPLTVNNYVIRCMNWAAAHGFEKVTDEVVNAI